jgi:hypothetical protein
MAGWFKFSVNTSLIFANLLFSREKTTSLRLRTLASSGIIYFFGFIIYFLAVLGTTQGLMLTRQALYCLNHSTSPFFVMDFLR